MEKRVKALSAKPVAFDQLVMADRAEEARAYKLYERQKGRPDQEALWQEASAHFHKSVEEAYPADFWNNFARSQ